MCAEQEEEMRFLVSFWMIILCCGHALAQASDSDVAVGMQRGEGAQQAQEPLTVFPHNDDARYLISGQANIIFQSHPGFHSPYEGTNSCLLYTSDAADDLLCV